MNKILSCIIFALILTGTSSPVMAERKLVIMIGQSETSGRGNLSQVPSYEHANRIWLFGNDGQWHNPGTEPTDSNVGQIYSVEDDGASIGSSFGMPLANRLAELYPDDEIAIINCSKGNSKITQFRQVWNPATRYGSCLARVKIALQSSTLYGMTFWVGATDAETQTDQATWAENFSNLITSWRVDLGDINMPVALAVHNNLSPAGKPYWNALRAVELSIAGRNIGLVSTDGISYDSIEVHPDTAGNQVVGVRFADTLYSLNQ